MAFVGLPFSAPDAVRAAFTDVQIEPHPASATHREQALIFTPLSSTCQTNTAEFFVQQLV
jgi:hypothetical protein